MIILACCPQNNGKDFNSTHFIRLVGQLLSFCSRLIGLPFLSGIGLAENVVLQRIAQKGTH